MHAICGKACEASYTSACSRSPSVQPSCLQLTSRCPFQLSRNADGSGLLWTHETIYSHAGALRMLAAQHNFIRTYTPTYVCIIIWSMYCTA